MKKNGIEKIPESGDKTNNNVKMGMPLNTEIVNESFLHESRDKGNPNKYPVSAFSFRQGALWFKSMLNENNS